MLLCMIYLLDIIEFLKFSLSQLQQILNLCTLDFSLWTNRFLLKHMRSCGNVLATTALAALEIFPPSWRWGSTRGTLQHPRAQERAQRPSSHQSGAGCAYLSPSYLGIGTFCTFATRGFTVLCIACQRSRHGAA